MNDQTYKNAVQHALHIVDKNLNVFVNKYPHVSIDNIYGTEENVLWTAAFFPGMCYLTFEMTGEEKYLCHMDDWLDSFEKRLDEKVHISHDLGFLYTLSSVAAYKLTKYERAEKLALRAADMLGERYHEKGKYIQAWGEMGIAWPDVKIIIDTMLNLPLLYWSRKDRLMQIAVNHAHTAADYLIRPDFSSYHTYLMEPKTGEAVCGKTHQGYADGSTWARGQAWAVYGFILSYRYTEEARFLHVAKETAEVFIRNLPKDYVPYWDFTFTDDKPDIRDTSAASIFCCGLLELCDHVEIYEAERYRKIADSILESLYENYSTKDIESSNGVLKDGVYHRNDGAEECVIWGDYFYMEALRRLKGDWNLYW